MAVVIMFVCLFVCLLLINYTIVHSIILAVQYLEIFAMYLNENIKSVIVFVYHGIYLYLIFYINGEGVICWPSILGL